MTNSTHSTRKSRLVLAALAAAGALMLSGLSGCVIRGGYGCGPVVFELFYGVARGCH